MNKDVKDILITVLASGALFSFLQFLLNRYDNKKNVEKKLSKQINDVKTEVKAEVNDVKTEVKNVKNGLEEHKATLARTHILRFADELRNGQIHSDEYFKQQILDIDTYDHYCDTHPEFANGLTRMASDFIREEYRKSYLNHDGTD